MTKHLPECQPESVPDPPFICICPELRACEDRAIAAAVQRIEALWSIDPSWDGTNWNNALHAATAVIRDAEGRP